MLELILGTLLAAGTVYYVLRPILRPGPPDAEAEGDERPVIALVPGDRRGDMRKIARAAGATRGRVAHAREVPALTGFAPGAVAPFALEQIDRVLIERVLLAYEELWIGAGSTRHMAVLPTRELVRLTKAAPADLVTAD